MSMVDWLGKSDHMVDLFMQIAVESNMFHLMTRECFGCLVNVAVSWSVCIGKEVFYNLWYLLNEINRIYTWEVLFSNKSVSE